MFTSSHAVLWQKLTSREISLFEFSTVTLQGNSAIQRNESSRLPVSPRSGTMQRTSRCTWKTLRRQKWLAFAEIVAARWMMGRDFALVAARQLLVRRFAPQQRL